MLTKYKRVFIRTSVSFLLPLLFMLVAIYSWGQTNRIDSLKQELESASISEQIDISLQLSGLLYYSNSKESKNYIDNALDLSRSKNDTAGISDSYYRLAYYYYDRGDFKKAIEMAREGLGYLPARLEDEYLLENRAILNNSLGNSYSTTGMYEIAMEAYLESMMDFEKLEDREGEALTILNMGTVFDAMDQDTSALRYYHRSAEIYRELGQDHELASHYNNIAEIFLQRQQYDSALVNYQRSVELNKENGTPLGEATAELNIGHLYCEQKEYGIAKNHVMRSLSLFSKAGDSSGVAYSRAVLADIAIAQKNFVTAERLLNQSYSFARKSGEADLTSQTLELLSSMNEDRGDYREALRWHRRLKAFEDSLENQNDNQAIEMMQMAYESEKKDLEIQRLEAEKEKRAAAAFRKDLMWYGSLVIILMLLVVGGILLYLNRKRKLAIVQLHEQRKDLVAKNRRIMEQQQQLHEANEELEERKRQAEEANAAKDQFLSVISHELRTPLNAVIGFTKLLQSGEHLEEQRDHIQGLESSSHILMDLINKILDLNKLESKAYLFENKPFSIQKVIKDTADIFKGELKRKDVELRTYIDKRIPAALMGDAYALRQIILNILGNAVKFTWSGYISMEVMRNSDRQVEGNPTQWIRLKISDTGVGIPADQLEYIFDKYKQSSANIPRNYGGTGLGLTIVKNMVEQLGGLVKAHSEEKKGTSFVVDLPYELAESDDVELNHDQTEIAENVSAPKGNGKLQILIAEDNEINTKVLIKCFERWGYSPDIAENGLIATQKAAEKNYDLIFMDLQMPQMDGFEASKTIRSHNDEVVIIALTANANPSVLQQVQDFGMNDYITKPFDLDSLQRLIERMEQDSYQNN